jgi:predicted TIM-barrel fold metal-dependent hydrolase
MNLGYAMYDADNHLYEAHDAFTRHLPESRRREVKWVTDERGHRNLIIDRHLYDYIPNPTFDPVAVAGALDRRMVEPLATRPEYRDRDARLRRLDEQGIEASLLFPTLINGLEEAIGDNIPLYADLMFGYNQWLEEEWGFSYRNRIFAVPMIPLSDPAAAVRMLEWVLAHGARAVMVPSNSVLTQLGRVSPAHAMFDPFWARCAEARVIVCAHTAANGYNRYSGDLTGHYTSRPFENHTLDNLINRGRPTSDFFAVMVWQGALTRFPALRLLSVENGSDWVGSLLARFRRFYRPGELEEDPVDVFHRCVTITPHWEDDLDDLVGRVPVTNVVAGSDWPHYDALPEPTDFAKYLVGFDDADVRKVMRDNLRSLLAAA